MRLLIQSGGNDPQRFAPSLPKPRHPWTECFRCGVCCIKFQAPLNPDEVQRVAAFLGIQADEFIRRFTDPRWQGKEKLLLHTNGACSFLNRDTSGKISDCLIHQVRPAACRDWVAGPDKRECREGLSQIWHLSVNDSGQLEGSAEQIAEFKEFSKNSLNDAV